MDSLLKLTVTGNTYRVRNRLKKKGFLYDSTGKWYCEADSSTIYALAAYCNRHGLKSKIEEKGFTRSNSYRDVFFRTYEGNANGKRYRCAYCGRNFPKSKITVDHIIPVSGVENSKSRNRFKMLLGKQEIHDVNDVRNLAAACEKCNKKKGTKAGLWILRGRLGKSETMWRIRWIIRWVLILFVLAGTACLVAKGPMFWANYFFPADVF